MREDHSIQELVESISRDLFDKPFRHKAYYNPRLRTTGGRYMLLSHNIELNKKYFDEHGMEELIGIIKHELCHYHLHLAGKGYKHRDHDFRQLIQMVGAPRFCTPLPSEKKKKRKRHLYQCINCEQQYIRKMKMNVSRYACGRCKGRLQYIGELQ
ncbi:SprT family protein [Jeotgalibacillus soli]|nr:SprT family protein [Jeotgalibacillus soli]